MDFINEEVEGFEFVENMRLTPIQQNALESLTGVTFLTEEEEKYFKEIHSIAFLEFLFNHMNPNEMEDYISMYLSEEKNEGYITK